MERFLAEPSHAGPWTGLPTHDPVQGNTNPVTNIKDNNGDNGTVVAEWGSVKGKE